VLLALPNNIRLGLKRLGKYKHSGASAMKKKVSYNYPQDERNLTKEQVNQKKGINKNHIFKRS
jgi:hypothetical protein